MNTSTIKFKVLPLLVSAFLVGCGGGSGGSDSSSSSGSDNVESCQDCGWDINQWKITIPVSRNDYYGSGGTSAAELIPANCSGKDTLSDNTDIPYFWVNGNKAHFKVDLGEEGATTTNSSYVRSELRELYHYETNNRCSSSNQNWGINGQNHSLNSSLSIDKYPSSAVNTNGDPAVIVGQVHGYNISQALIKLQWEGNDKPVRAILNDDFLPNNDKCTDGKWNNQPCPYQSFSINLGTYSAQTDWEYTIKVDDIGITLSTVSQDSEAVVKTLKWGDEVIDNKGNSILLSNKWKNETYYFKAGIYPQVKPNTNYSGQVFQVSFDKINVTHQ